MQLTEGDDFRALAEMGSALWANPERSRSLVLDTYTAVALLDLSEERLLERTTQALLDQATRGEGNAGQTLANLQVAGVLREAYFRLDAEERVILMALHRGHWSYLRLGRILKLTPEQVEEMAWGARLKLSEGKYPAGASSFSAHCPEYVASRPWTQRFLDEELPSRDRIFLQNHLMACDSCRRALGRCRDLYYSIEKKLPEASSELQIALQEISRQAARVISPSNMSLGEGLGRFLNRWDARIGVAVFLGIAFIILKRLFF